jgi:hypothetical protein
LQKFMFVRVLWVTLGLSLSAETALAKTTDPQPAVCRTAAAAPPLKLLTENGLFAPIERMSRRAPYTLVPTVAAAKEQAPVLLERQPKPVSLIVGVGF